ncbi:MAG: LacI family transcriptional regulator [Armatimonadetes bacterium]|nr:LacI family transcriptional regulator [Armatimonadota bacterium]
MEKRFVNIHDVARDANVSIATVSRVLNEPGRVSADTRDKVAASVERLGYTPNLRARLLARGDSGMICFLLSNRPFIHSVHAQVLQGAAREADELSVQIVYAACSYSPDTPPSEIEMPRILAARRLIDGVIVAGTNYPNMLDAIDELELPRVVYGPNLVTANDVRIGNSVYVDDEGGGYEATAHLISLGHEKIWFVGDLSMPWYRRRYAGYRLAMSEAGIRSLPAVGSMADGELQMGHDGAEGLLERGEAVTALFVGSDMGAFGAMRAIKARGLRVPEDVSVVGFNGEELAEIAEPPLTTIRVPTEDAGMRCVEMLNSIIKGKEANLDPVVLPVQLIRRQSAVHRIESRRREGAKGANGKG